MTLGPSFRTAAGSEYDEAAIFEKNERNLGARFVTYPVHRGHRNVPPEPKLSDARRWASYTRMDDIMNRIPHYFSLDIFQRLKRWRLERCLQLIVTWTADLTEDCYGSIVAATARHLRPARPSGGANCT